MSQHEAFLKALRVEPNDPFHERIYSDFLRDEGYDPPEKFVAIARVLAPHLHSSLQTLSLGRRHNIGRFGVEVLVSCSYLTALREISLPGIVLQWDNKLRPVQVVPNIGEEGIILLVGSPLMEQIRYLDIRYNQLGPRGIAALLRSPYLDNLEHLCIDEPAENLPVSDWNNLVERFGDRLRRTL